MRRTAECFPCAERQTLRVLNVALSHPEAPSLSQPERKDLEEDLIRKARKRLAQMPSDISPAELSYVAIKLVYETLNLNDPYSVLKKDSNREALQILPEMREWIRSSEDPLETAARMAVAGNIIDLGIRKDYDIHESIRQILEEGFVIDHLERFLNDLKRREESGSGGEVLYICDNAGEIAFDRLFLEVLIEHFPKTTFVAGVNSGPILNDATMEDAVAVGLTAVVPVIENGYDLLGTVLSQVSPGFRRIFDKADWVISKGQANYETLDGVSSKILFLLKAKCDPIAEHVGVALYQGVFKQSDDRYSLEGKENASPVEVETS